MFVSIPLLLYTALFFWEFVCVCTFCVTKYHIHTYIPSKINKNDKLGPKLFTTTRKGKKKYIKVVWGKPTTPTHHI